MFSDENGDRIDLIMSLIERGRARPEHQMPEIPSYLNWLIEIYADISSEDKLKYFEILSFSWSTGIELTVWDIHCLRLIDKERLRIKSHHDQKRLDAQRLRAEASQSTGIKLR